MQKFSIGIIGGAGYTGGELLRILLNHPAADITFVHSRSNAGRPVWTAHPDLLGETDMHFTEDFSAPVDVLFLCVGHGEAKKFLDEVRIGAATKIIDLSQDFRLLANAQHNEGKFVYGLPELNREQIKAARNIANPGCFATAIQLGLLPLAKAGLLEDVYTTGITGATGAGQSLAATSHFSWRAANIGAYKTLSHQHLQEIGQSLSQLQPAKNVDLSFVPWRGDFTRGIFTSSTLHCTAKRETLVELFLDYYKTHPFVHINQEAIYLKQVVNTNKCVVQLEKLGSKLVVHSAIDNLTKGASGQAVQNMNLMLGLPEDCGLKLKPSAF